MPNHSIHRELKTQCNKYGENIIRTKKQHWADYLENMSGSDIWTANRYIKQPVGDGGSPRIPTLHTKDGEGVERETRSSEDKASLFANTFFPPPPATSSVPPNYAYPDPLPSSTLITAKRIEQYIQRLSPYKACPDEIPNVVLQKCADLLSKRLGFVFRAILKLGIYYDPWREFV